jgi:pimeloyl-ACP methyl ester carboxylesterase
MLPGLDGTGELFANVLQHLQPEFETQIVTYPPKRVLSYTELEEKISTLLKDSPPFMLLAESFSGPIAIRYAASLPTNLQGLILCNTFACSPVSGSLRLLTSAVAPITFRLPLPPPLARRYLLGPAASTDAILQLQQALSLVQPNVLSARLDEVFHCDVRDCLSRITVPVLALQAQQDRLVPARATQELQRHSKNLHVVTLLGPHLLLQSNPRQAAKAISAFARPI